MTNGLRCCSSAVLLLLLPLLFGLTLPYTASGAYLDTIVQCDETLPYACATRLFASSFPCPPTTPPSNTTMNPQKRQQPTPAPSAPCVDIEEHSVSYAFTTGLTNGTDTHGNASMGYTGFFTTVSWFGINETCVATVNDTMCASCATCNTTENLFSVDCTNLPSGVTTNCTSISPVFYPLDASFPYPNTTIHPGGGGSSNMTTMAPSMPATTSNVTTTMTPTSSLFPTLAPSNMTSSMIPTSTNMTMMPTSSSSSSSMNNHSMVPTSSNVSTNVPTASPIGTSTLAPTKKPPSTSGANGARRWTTTTTTTTTTTLLVTVASSPLSLLLLLLWW